MKTFWLIASGLCGVAAVVFVVRDDYDNAFIAAALGAVAWFLNFRTRLRETLDKDERDTSKDADNNRDTDS